MFNRHQFLEQVQIQFLEQVLKFLVNFTLLKYVKSQRSCGFLITKELIFGFQILDLKDHFSASLKISRKEITMTFFQAVNCDLRKEDWCFSQLIATLT